MPVVDLKMSSNCRPTRGQVRRFTTVVEMEAAGLPTSTTINNTIMARQVSRRKKLRTTGDDQQKRKNAARNRLLKKLEKRKAEKAKK